MKTSNVIALLAAIASLTACGTGNVQAGDASDGDNADALSTKGRFEIFVGSDGRYYFHLLAGNGEKVLASQAYSSSSSAQTGINSVKTNGVDASKYQLRAAADGSPYFVLKAGNGAVIGVSQLYTTQSNATAAIADVVSVVQATAPQPVAPDLSSAFSVFKGLDGKYYFDLRAANGEIVLQSQAYTTKASASAGVISVEANGTSSSRFQIRSAADGEQYFVLKAANGAVVGLSEMYVSTANAERGEATVISLLSGDSN